MDVKEKHFYMIVNLRAPKIIKYLELYFLLDSARAVKTLSVSNYSSLRYTTTFFKSFHCYKDTFIFVIATVLTSQQLVSVFFFFTTPSRCCYNINIHGNKKGFIIAIS